MLLSENGTKGGEGKVGWGKTFRKNYEKMKSRSGGGDQKKGLQEEGVNELVSSERKGYCGRGTQKNRQERGGKEKA